jgi:Domain of unknown function (DUF4249)
MTHFRTIIALAASAAVTFLTLTRCSNDFDLTANWEEIPVVYGILSPSDTAHYVRIEKAFLDKERSAFEVAQIADSLYFAPNTITVFLERVSTGQEYQLTRVDGNLEGHVRNSGPFATTPNWLYKIKNSAIPGGLRVQERYRIIIRRADGKPDITGETIMPDESTLLSPNMSNTPPRMNFFPRTNATYRWAHDVNSVYFDLAISIRYREENSVGATVARDTLLWRPGQAILAESAQSTKFTTSGESFYTFLSQNIQPAAQDRTRFFDRCEVVITGGGREIFDFIQVNQANGGLTGAEIIRTYSNMSEGYGIFSGRTVSRFPGIRIWEETIDSMRVHPLTAPLKFEFL